MAKTTFFLKTLKTLARFSPGGMFLVPGIYSENNIVWGGGVGWGGG